MAAPLSLIVSDEEAARDRRLIIDDFADPGASRLGTRWRGFSDRVMGGMSDGTLTRTTVAGRPCIRLTGVVTRKRNGGFLQMALDLAQRPDYFDASAYRGIELLVHGNDEHYNVHLRTADVRWYDQSYRTTFHAAPQWQRLRLPWNSFTPHGLNAPLDISRLRRIGVMGWMREFEMDLALGEIALYE
ncbi:MAG: CIA30 family protein [Gammaproteobacteria bacterium]|nr:CIA30 family protein [Gammaproteobacteria bacterium]